MLDEKCLSVMAFGCELGWRIWFGARFGLSVSIPFITSVQFSKNLF